jgi:hypothetical protein
MLLHLQPQYLLHLAQPDLHKSARSLPASRTGRAAHQQVVPGYRECNPVPARFGIMICRPWRLE